MTGGIFYIVNYVWPLWDKDRQALHDKMVETLVVEAAPPATSSRPSARRALTTRSKTTPFAAPREGHPLINGSARPRPQAVARMGARRAPMTTESSNIRHGYALATWLQRLIAHLIDRLIVGAIVLVGLFGLAVGVASRVADEDASPKSDWVPFVAQIIARALEGDWGWGLVAAAALRVPHLRRMVPLRAQRRANAGKQIVGVRVIRANGEPSGWGLAFLREVIIEWIVVGFLSAMTGGIFYVLNYVWPLWDKDRQALHDKMVETLVVEAAPPATPPASARRALTTRSKTTPFASAASATSVPTP